MTKKRLLKIIKSALAHDCRYIVLTDNIIFLSTSLPPRLYSAIICDAAGKALCKVEQVDIVGNYAAIDTDGLEFC